MKIYSGLDELPRRARAAVVTIGNFDGVHKGHLASIRKIRALGDALDAIPTVLTFDPHPQQVLRGVSPAKLTNFETKAGLLAGAGVGQLVVMKFDKKVAESEPEEFIDQVLVKRLRMSAFVGGSDFRFGRFRRGDVGMLRSYGRRLGFRVETVRLARLDGRLLSSTEIRKAISERDLAWANKALGRPHKVPGKVIRSVGRGKGLGFPTANLGVASDLCLPGTGIYAGSALIESRSYPAAISVGTNPTFGKNPISIEAYILDFEREIYGRQLGLEFAKFLRAEKAFRTKEALIRAMGEDVAQVRAYFGYGQ